MAASLLAAGTAAYLSTGAVAKHRTAAGPSLVSGLIGRAWLRPLAVIELGVALAAAWPSGLQRPAAVLQAVLLSVFVVVTVVARRANRPCRCFGDNERRPGRARIVAAMIAAAAGWLVAASSPPRPVALLGVALGCLMGFALVRQRPEQLYGYALDPHAVDGLPITRRVAIARAAEVFAAVAAASLLGWRSPRGAAALEGDRSITPRRPREDEVTAARSSAAGMKLLSQHEVDAAEVEWQRTTVYDLKTPNGGVAVLVAPIGGSALSYAFIGTDTVERPDLVAVLDKTSTGWAASGDASYELAGGRVIGMPTTDATTGSFIGDWNDCLTDFSGLIAVCCAVCGFSPMWGPCCGGCGLGAAIGCLWLAIK